jgi:hypothetical protein
MSYCRFGRDSDVYVYEAENGIECCGCRLLDVAFFTAAGPGEMLEHLMAHRAAGHAVPESALEELRGEAAEAAGS